jgi:hypothetical protein
MNAAALATTIPLYEKLSIIAQLCLEAEEGWWTWHEDLQYNVFAFMVFGMMSTDLMLGNPAAGATSVLGNYFVK